MDYIFLGFNERMSSQPPQSQPTHHTLNVCYAIMYEHFREKNQAQLNVNKYAWKWEKKQPKCEDRASERERKGGKGWLDIAMG